VTGGEIAAVVIVAFGDEHRHIKRVSASAPMLGGACNVDVSTS
jgi:hypothetical protein